MFSAPSSVALLLGAQQIGQLTPTASGLNIVGGRGCVLGEACLVKFVAGDAASAQLAVDALKPLFGQRAIGCRVGRLRDDYRIGAGVRPAGASVLLLRWVDGMETAKEATRRLRGPRGPAIDLRPADGAVFARWLEALCFRLLVCGARDPWSNIGWVEGEQQAVSFDEGSAFSDSLAPGSGWPYFAAPMKLAAEVRRRLFVDGCTPVHALAERWAQVQPAQVRDILAEFYDGAQLERRVAYVCGNVANLNETFARMCGVSAFISAQIAAARHAMATSVVFAEPPASERAYNKQPFLGGYNVSEARSWMQKAARRALGAETRFAAMLMLASQNITNLLGRLATMAVEDVLSPRCVLAVTPLWQVMEELRRVAPWREMRDWPPVRQAVAQIASTIAAEPTCRVADHVAALYFKPDHPYVSGADQSRGWTVPEGAPPLEEAEYAVERLLASNPYSEQGERRLLYTIGGLFMHRGGKAETLMARIAQAGRQVGNPQLTSALGFLSSMYHVIHQKGVLKGKLFIICAALFVYRAAAAGVPAEHVLRWHYEGGGPAAVSDDVVVAEYMQLIDGSRRLPVPTWAHDKHTGVAEGKSVFCAREQAACMGDGVLTDAYAAEAVAAEQHREACEKARPRVKRVCQ